MTRGGLHCRDIYELNYVTLGLQPFRLGSDDKASARDYVVVWAAPAAGRA